MGEASGTAVRQTERDDRVRAICPKGRHPFDYLAKGHAYLYSGLQLLEERDDLEDAEIEGIRKLLKPYQNALEKYSAMLSGGSDGEP